MFEAETNRNRYDPFGRCHGILRVGAENAAPCDPVAFMEVGDGFPDGNHCSCSLLSRSERKLIAITTLPHIEVDEITPVTATRINTSSCWVWAWESPAGA